MAAKPVKMPKGFHAQAQPTADDSYTPAVAPADAEGLQLIPEILKVTEPKPAKAPKVKAPKSILDLPPESLPVTDLPSGPGWIPIPADMVSKINGVKGSGGWQSLMADIASHIAGDGETYMLKVTPALLDKMIPYAVKFGGGGYQSTIRLILCLFLQVNKSAVLKGMAL